MMKRTIAVLALAPLLAVDSPASQNRRTPVVEAVDRALPSVVNIGTERLVQVQYRDTQRRLRGDLFDQLLREFFGVPPPPGYQVRHSLGSGVIIDPDGYILTNYHVIERASVIRVTLADESQYFANFLAGDEISDLALIKVEAGDEPLPAIRLAPDDDLLLGETVIALGNPFGLAQTVTVGVLSAKNREAVWKGEVLYKDILQTDAAINPGSSGGPLLNIEGDLIGVSVAIYPEAQNIGFAVPVKRARALLTRWFSPRLLKKIWLGFEVDSEEGKVVVREVEPESPATAVQLRDGDVIKAVEGNLVSSLFDFNKAMLACDEGDEIRLDVERGGVVRPVDMVLAALPRASGEQLAARLLGLGLMEGPEFSAAGVQSLRKGLFVKEVVTGGPAQRAGLQPGLFITRIGEVDIGTLDDVAVALEHARPGDTVMLTVVNVVESDAFIMAQSSVVALGIQEPVER